MFCDVKLKIDRPTNCSLISNIRLVQKRHKISVLERHCAEIGRDPAEIQKSAVGVLIFTETEQEAAELQEKMGHRSGLVGTPAQLRQVVAEYAAVGVDELLVPDFAVSTEKRNDYLDRFRAEVVNY